MSGACIERVRYGYNLNRILMLRKEYSMKACELTVIGGPSH